MQSCERMRALVYRTAEGEVTPDEAMRVARHLSDCTGCRILLARERRLAALLESDLEDQLPVGEEFVRGVMANLPKGPPPRPQKRRKLRRWLRLAGFVGLLFALPLVGPDGGGPAAAPHLLARHLPEHGVTDGWITDAAQLVRGAALLLGAGRADLPLPELPLLPLALPLLAIAPLMLLSGAVTLLVLLLAGGGLLRRSGAAGSRV